MSKMDLIELLTVDLVHGLAKSIDFGKQWYHRKGISIGAEQISAS